jgi:hypothetical protein
MDSIKDIVSGVMGRMSSGNGVSFQDIQAAWARISKDQGSRAVNFKDGCVTISANSSLCLVRLNLNRESLLKELQKEFPSIVKISFKVGAI